MNVPRWLVSFWSRVPPKPRRFFEKYWIKTALGGIASFLVLFILIDWIAMPLIVRHGSESVVPDVMAMTPDTARIVLDSSDLRLAVANEDYSPTVAAGRVMEQHPVPGAVVKSGRVVNVTLSRGSSVVSMPDLAGVKLDQAQRIVQNLRLVSGAVEYVVRDSLPPDIVISTTPEAGDSIEMGQEVSFVVTRGKTENLIIVPNLVGLTLAEAKRAAHDFGFMIGVVTEVVDERYIPGTIIDQSVLEGTQSLEGVVIDLTVSAEGT
jgi:beta-lactam-binding protein with PASTA domain